ncbi:MAG TPA: hypothetical protein VGN82_17035 [Bosea sp. (in: a-proteobacteria)]|uniref:hypothetical protein n=1 Tax=Bosea sp. (in: a-proteobacteria) TaxID=1871050 RepID=UPI002E13E266|nr:hypothetical protein [Bosea sp. (in: a-proteobacteria)]
MQPSLAQQGQKFDPNMDYDEMQRQYLPGMLQELRTDKRKQREAYDGCVKLFQQTLPVQCRKNLPHLDKSRCTELMGTRSEIERTCRAMASGKTASGYVDKQGRHRHAPD